MTSSTTTNAEAPARPSAIPTLLTVFRIAMGPVVAALVLWAASLLHLDPQIAGLIYALALILFVLAALTDWLDGYLARKWNAVTPLGAALDHAADKVLITCALVALAYAALPMALAEAAVIILGRDVAVAGLREGISAQGKTLPVSQLGKWKAAAEMAGVGAYLAFQTAVLLSAPLSVMIGLDWAARLLIWSAAVLALISGAQYVGALLKRD
ncbi:MAG: CDP-diacylglycerol--glycerol-3-phosphate 3-phosphatidyltransferase [Hyphomonadaceae bacterium]|nr:CDP-diacylglycerol--glycerol-3-phosphate 3-phosphatidyltransferase [Hyphomonadaceae bacterium]MCA8885686.1 CDP-diacylglycerol--glycerol-3-phosphate 3-phosphatidyltransferase [Hyphomonadaceae bacterium]